MMEYMFLPYTFGCTICLRLVQANAEVFFSAWRYPVVKNAGGASEVLAIADVIAFPPERIVRRAA